MGMESSGVEGAGVGTCPGGVVWRDGVGVLCGAGDGSGVRSGTGCSREEMRELEEPRVSAMGATVIEKDRASRGVRKFAYE
jgi:hypothetical protein